MTRTSALISYAFDYMSHQKRISGDISVALMEHDTWILDFANVRDIQNGGYHTNGKVVFFWGAWSS